MRTFWVAFGIGTHVLFGWTVYRLFPFLAGTSRGLASAYVPAGLLPWYALDSLLALQFAVLHSFLLLRRVRERVERHIPPPLYGCIFCTMACLSLLLTIEFWEPSSVVFWQLRESVGVVVRGAFLFTWPVLVYSLSLTGLGYQTGWTPWWAWVRGRRPPPRKFQPRGAYRLLRHPVYLSFLGLVWLVPEATLDRVLLIGVWTIYIFVGSTLKDRRLLSYLGDTYRRYQARVPGYPFFPVGPLARVPWQEPAADSAATRRAA